MPQNKYAFARYRLIDQLLRRQTYVKTSYIVEICEQRLGYTISQRMIQMDLEAMRYDSFLGFFAPIEYCKKRKAYYYTDHKFQLISLNFTQEEIDTLTFLCNYIKDQLSKLVYFGNKIVIKN